MIEPRLQWTAYMRYRAELRRLDLARIEEIVRYSPERYVDQTSGRLVAVGRFGESLLMVPYEAEPGLIRPVTAHVTTRAQIEARLKSGRLRHE